MRNEINTMIATAMKSGNSIELNALRAIKTAFMNWSTSADNAGKEMTDADELKILLKMKAQREDSINQYKAGGREDLVESETAELNALLKFIPAQPTDEEIESYTKEIASKIEGLSMKDMKNVLAKVQEKYPTANGKIVSQVVKSMI